MTLDNEGPRRTFTRSRRLTSQKNFELQGDTNTYPDISYQQQGALVWIRTVRYALLKQYSSLYSLLVGPDASGTWLIYEERSVTRPEPVRLPYRVDPSQHIPDSAAA